MTKRRTAGAGAIAIVVLALAGIGIAVVSSDGGGSVPNWNASVAGALARIHVRNLQLESILPMLQSQGKPTPPRAVASPPHNASNSAPQPVEAEPPSEPSTEEANCDPNYEGACLDPRASDYDCEGGSGDGPDYTAKSPWSGKIISASTGTATESDVRWNSGHD